MGTFIAIGLVTRVSVQKSALSKVKWDIIQLQDKMKTKLQYNSELYEMHEEENAYRFLLKEAILHQQLIPFLEKIYPIIYADYPDAYSGVIEKLKGMPPSEWIAWSKDSYTPAFQYSQYGMDDYFRDGFDRVAISYHALLISLEGKAIMEEYTRHFAFFKYTMMQAFQQFSLSGALRVYLT